MDNALYSVDIERQVLQTIISNPSEFEDIADIINSHAFYIDAHKSIFEAMAYCHKSSNAAISVDFIAKYLREKGKFDKAMEDEILEIVSLNPLSNVQVYVYELLEMYKRREFVDLKNIIEKNVSDQPLNDLIDGVQRKLFEISLNSEKGEFRDSYELGSKTLEHIKKMKELGNVGITGLDTGYRQLNELTLGLNQGDLIIIAARPAMGKTAFCLNLAQKVLNQNYGVAIFSLEMPGEQLVLRMLSAKTSIPLQKLRVGDLNDEQWQDLTCAINDLENSKLFVEDSGTVNINHIRSKLRKLKIKHPEIKLCIIDYLQLMSGNANKDRHLEVSEISRGLKLLARELEMPIIALSQLNRSLENRGDKRPMLSDLRESGSIEQDADMILFVYRDDVYRIREEKEKEQKARAENKTYISDFQEKANEDAEIIIGKNRNGPIGVAQLVFHKKTTQFTEPSNENKIDYKPSTLTNIKAQDGIPITYKEKNKDENKPVEIVNI